MYQLVKAFKTFSPDAICELPVPRRRRQRKKITEGRQHNFITTVQKVVFHQRQRQPGLWYIHTGMGPGPVQGPNGKYSTMWKCSHWSKTGTGPIVSYCASPIPCTDLGHVPVQCDYTISHGIVWTFLHNTLIPINPGPGLVLVPDPVQCDCTIRLVM